MLLLLLACMPALPLEQGSFCDGFHDDDGDGWGGEPWSIPCDQVDDTWVEQDGDCDDADPDTFPDAPAPCESADRNCDGVPDDQDGDQDGFPGCEECDDTRADVFPGADEVCDDVDQDCDDAVDEDAIDGLTAWIDQDGDTWGDEAVWTCPGDPDVADRDGDCVDTDPDIHPERPEVCDDVDQDCDVAVDEDAIDAPTWYQDLDEDTYGDTDSAVTVCDAPEGYVATDGDCDVVNPAVNPDAVEVCDGIDNDCDGSVDPDTSEGAPTWYRDSDTDGYGDATITTIACDEPSGYVALDTDCDDAVDSVYPGADEVCDETDQDCDTVTDEDAIDALTWYYDNDSDGYGATNNSTESCTQPTGYAAVGGDCAHSRADINPGATETCDDEDDDCDTVVDENASDAVTWYYDGDGDGDGDSAGGTVDACDVPTGYAATDSDCDDNDATSYTGATEICDAADNDCDTSTDEGFTDTDSDGTADCVDDCPVYADASATSGGHGGYASPYDSIATAISMRGEYCDDIVLFAGTFTETVDYGGVDLDISSISGAATTIIDASSTTGSVVTFSGGETTAAVLEGVTLTGGTGTAGDGSSFSAADFSTLDSSLTYGGGIYIYASDPTITDCVIEANVATDFGGGIFAHDYQGSISGTTFDVNEAEGDDAGGGGIYLSDSSPTISECTFTDNTASGDSGDGGGLYAYGGGPDMDTCWFQENDADDYGSGLRLWSTSGSLTNSVIFGHDGDGLALTAAATTDVVNNTFYKNDWGIYLNHKGGNYYSGDVINNIIAESAEEPVGVSKKNVCSTWTYEYNNIWASSSSYDSTISDCTLSSTNLTGDPGFTDAANEDFTLLSTSALVDAGTDTSTSYGVTDDHDGVSRPSGTAYSIGAYE